MDGMTLTYGDLKRRILQSVAWLRTMGLEQGNVLAVQLEKKTSCLELILAGISMGCTVLPLNHRFTAEEVSYFLEDSRADLAILPTRSFPLDQMVPIIDSETVDSRLNCSPVDKLPDCPPGESCALLLYTSGTTGRSKGAVITHKNLMATIDGLHSAWEWRSSDVLLHVLPIFHVHGLIVAQFGALRAGATAIWLARFTPESAESAIIDHSVSIMMAVPTLYHRILSDRFFQKDKIEGIRLFTSGSAPLSVAAHEAFFNRTGHVILERYGMTEVGIVLSNPYRGKRLAGSVGVPVSGAEIRIVNPETGKECLQGTAGEVWIRGPSVIAEYLRRPKQSADTILDGWLRSGDLGMHGQDGYYRIVGRLKDMIISGGENVYPRAVEAVLLSKDGIDQAAVVGLPDPEWGERVVAAVISPEAVNVSELMEYCKERLAPWKRPKEIIVVREFPRNAMGKVQKALIRKRWPNLI